MLECSGKQQIGAYLALVLFDTRIDRVSKARLRFIQALLSLTKSRFLNLKARNDTQRNDRIISYGCFSLLPYTVNPQVVHECYCYSSIQLDGYFFAV